MTEDVSYLCKELIGLVISRANIDYSVLYVYTLRELNFAAQI